MVVCPFCGEGISADARICKHCQRSTLYSISLISPLDEKQKHLFIRLWQSAKFENLKHTTLDSYSSAKAQLDKVPLLLSWDLNLNEAEAILRPFKSFPIDKQIQGGIPSTLKIEEPVRESNWAGVFYAVLGVSILAMGAYVAYATKMRSSPNEPQLAQDFSSQDFDMSAQSPHLNGPTVSHPNANLIPNSHEGLQRDEVETALSATVFIRDASRLGSGFLITSDGYILSNSHVTSEMLNPIVILHDGRQYEAEKIREDKTLDIALIKINETGLTYLKLGDANNLYPGQAIVAVGNPGGLSFTVTRGIVSYVGRNLNGVPYIQTDAAINRGNSGGPMINSDLEVVGINTLTSTQEQGISFSIPINFVCSGSGLATHVATTPSSCPPFQTRGDPLITTSIEGHQGTPNSPAQPATPSFDYNSEADALKATLDRNESEFKEEEERLKAAAAAAKASLDADPLNGSLQDRVNQKLANLQTEVTSLSKKRAQSQFTYANQLISLLERQRLDPAYSRYVSTIDVQIQSLKVSRQKLQDFLRQ